jgi:hypothetical protein
MTLRLTTNEGEGMASQQISEGEYVYIAYSPKVFFAYYCHGD